MLSSSGDCVAGNGLTHRCRLYGSGQRVTVPLYETLPPRGPVMEPLPVQVPPEQLLVPWREKVPP
jgi:hypothetical protein